MNLLASSFTLAGDDASTIINALGDNLVMGIFFGTINSAQQRKEREKTKRELAAYVAEGSMTPADAERILKAGEEED
jgi:hypothetical protein